MMFVKVKAHFIDLGAPPSATARSWKHDFNTACIFPAATAARFHCWSATRLAHGNLSRQSCRTTGRNCAASYTSCYHGSLTVVQDHK